MSRGTLWYQNGVAVKYFLVHVTLFVDFILNVVIRPPGNTLGPFLALFWYLIRLPNNSQLSVVSVDLYCGFIVPSLQSHVVLSIGLIWNVSDTLPPLCCDDSHPYHYLFLRSLLPSGNFVFLLIF